MQTAWPFLYLACVPAVAVYLVLCVVPGRVQAWEKRFNDGLFIIVVALVGIRIFARYLFHGSLVFQFALVFAGFAAAIGILLRVKALVARYAASSRERSG